jgi:hypothetical protein
MDLLPSHLYDSDCSDSDSTNGFLGNLQAVPGGVAAVPTANLEDNNVEDVFTNEEGNPGAIQKYPGEGSVNSQDTGLFKYSPAEVNILTKLEQTTRYLFPPDNSKVYVKDELRDALRAHGQSAGFAISTESSSFRCTRAWERKGRQTQRSRRVISPSKKRIRQTSRCGCDFIIKFTSVKGTKDQVKITSGSHYRHWYGCFPGRTQLVADKQSAGSYTRPLDLSQMQSIVTVIRSDPRVSARCLRNLMRPLFPEGFDISSQEISNLRLKVKRLLIRDDTPTFLTAEDHKFLTASNEDALDAQSPSFVDEATLHVRDILRNALNESTDSRRIEKLLEDLVKKDAGFAYRIARADNGSISGYIYMTSVMRARWERYGDVLFLDAMKRQLNSLHWPYLSVVCLEGDKRIVVCVEGICCAERLDAYEWILRSMFAMGPKRKPAEVRMFFGDGIFGQGATQFLERLGLEETSYLAIDEYHLLYQDWPRYFGDAWPKFTKLFQNYVYSQTVEECETNYTNLKDSVKGNAKWSQYIDKAHGNKATFVRCYIQAVCGKCATSILVSKNRLQSGCAHCTIFHLTGNLERHGSVPSEINHSSFVQRVGPCSSEEPAIAMKMMLERQADLSFKRHRQLALYYSRCLAKVRMKKVTGEDAKALLGLSEWGFELWLQFKSEAGNYELQDDSIEEGIVNIVRIGSNAPPRRIGPGLSCECKSSIAYGSICPHHICYREGSFCLDDWITRFHQVPALEKSSEGGVVQTMDEVVMEKSDPSESAMNLVESENERDEDNLMTGQNRQ